MTMLKHPFMVASIAAILFGVSLSYRVNLIHGAMETLPDVATTTEPVISLRDRTEAYKREQQFKALHIEGQAAVIWDATDKKLLYSRKGETQLPLASLTKIMLVYVATKYMPPDTVLTVTGDDLKEEGSSGIVPGDTFRFGDFRTATLVASLNDGANTISRTLGDVLLKKDTSARAKQTTVEIMNQTAQDLGLHQAVYYNEDGLDISQGQPGALGSAEDVAIVFSAFLDQYPEALFPTTKLDYALHSLKGHVYQYFNTNQHVGEIPNILASKTGFTDLAGGNLAVSALAPNGHVLTYVILGSTKEGRFSDVKELSDFYLRTISK